MGLLNGLLSMEMREVMHKGGKKFTQLILNELFMKSYENAMNRLKYVTLPNKPHFPYTRYQIITKTISTIKILTINRTFPIFRIASCFLWTELIMLP